MPSSVVGGAALQEGGLELQPVGAVVDPGAAGLDELAGADRGRGADHGHQLPLPADLDPQHAEAGLGVVEGDPLDQAGQGLALGLLRIGPSRRSGGARRDEAVIWTVPCQCHAQDASATCPRAALPAV